MKKLCISGRKFLQKRRTESFAVKLQQKAGKNVGKGVLAVEFASRSCYFNNRNLQQKTKSGTSKNKCGSDDAKK